MVSLGLVSKLVKADKADKAVSHSVKVVSQVATMPRASFLEKVKARGCGILIALPLFCSLAQSWSALL